MDLPHTSLDSTYSLVVCVSTSLNHLSHYQQGKVVYILHERTRECIHGMSADQIHSLLHGETADKLMDMMPEWSTLSENQRIYKIQYEIEQARMVENLSNNSANFMELIQAERLQ